MFIDCLYLSDNIFFNVTGTIFPEICSGKALMKWQNKYSEMILEEMLHILNLIK